LQLNSNYSNLIVDALLSEVFIKCRNCWGSGIHHLNLRTTAELFHAGETLHTNFVLILLRLFLTETTLAVERHVACFYEFIIFNSSCRI